MAINKQVIPQEIHRVPTSRPRVVLHIGLFLQVGIDLVNRFWWLLTLLMLVAITWLSLSGPPPVRLAFSMNDKVLHLVAYAGLVMPVALAKPKYWFVYVLGLLVCGGAIEIIQPLFARQMDIGDLMANGTGLILGIALVELLKKVMRVVALFRI